MFTFFDSMGLFQSSLLNLRLSTSVLFKTSFPLCNDRLDPFCRRSIVAVDDATAGRQQWKRGWFAVGRRSIFNEPSSGQESDPKSKKENYKKRDPNWRKDRVLVAYVHGTFGRKQRGVSQGGFGPCV